MRHAKITAVIILAVVLQSSLRRVWPPLGYIDLALIVVVYFALQREFFQALIFGAIIGLAADALGSGLLGAGGFSKTVVAYVIVTIATRINLDNPLSRIPLLAGSAALDDLVYVGLNKVFSQHPQAPFIETLSFKLISTTVVGTLMLILLDHLLSEKFIQRRQFAFRRRAAKRSIKGFRKRR